jgi:hypothetical protein
VSAFHSDSSHKSDTVALTLCANRRHTAASRRRPSPGRDITQYLNHRFRDHRINLLILGTTAKSAMLDRPKAAADGVEIALGQFVDAVNRQCWRRIILGVAYDLLLGAIGSETLGSRLAQWPSERWRERRSES